MSKTKVDVLVPKNKKQSWSWPDFLNRLKKTSSKEAEKLTKAILCDTEVPEEGCCTKWTCGAGFCMADVMCIAVGFMLLLVIVAQAYKVVMEAREDSSTRRTPNRQRSRCSRC